MDSYSLDHVFSQALLGLRYLRSHRQGALLTHRSGRVLRMPSLGGHVSRRGSLQRAILGNVALLTQLLERPLRIAACTSALPISGLTAVLFASTSRVVRSALAVCLRYVTYVALLSFTVSLNLKPRLSSRP